MVRSYINNPSTIRSICRKADKDVSEWDNMCVQPYRAILKNEFVDEHLKLFNPLRDARRWFPKWIMQFNWKTFGSTIVDWLTSLFSVSLCWNYFLSPWPRFYLIFLKPASPILARHFMAFIYTKILNFICMILKCETREHVYIHFIPKIVLGSGNPQFAIQWFWHFLLYVCTYRDGAWQMLADEIKCSCHPIHRIN